MYYDTKHFIFMTGEPCLETPPKLYLDFYKLKANVKKFTFADMVVINLGIFGFYMFMEFRWNHVKDITNGRFWREDG